GCRVQRAAQKLLVVTIVLVHASLSSKLRSADMARAVWLLTAPVLIPIVEAICASDRRSTSASRCRGGSVRSAATTAERSASAIASCSALGMSGGGFGACRSTTIRCRTTERDRLTTDRRRYDSALSLSRRRRQPPCIATNDSCTTSSAVATSRTSSAARRTKDR